MPDPKTPIQYPALLEPSQDLASLQASVLRLKEVVEMLTGQRGAATYSLQAGLLQIQNQFVSGDKTVSAKMLELNEVTTTATTALAQRTFIVESTLNTPTTGVTARLTDLYTATVDVNNASSLARRITTAEASYNGISASGHVRLEGVANPTGATATYEWQLTTTSTGGSPQSIGMQAHLKDGGTGAITFTTGSFGFRDSGTLQTVFSYSAGKFTFNGNVEINGTLIVNGTVDNPKITNNAVSYRAATLEDVATGAGTTLYVTARGGETIVVNIAIWDPTGASFRAAANTPLATVRSYNVYVNGGYVTTSHAIDMIAASNYLGGSSYQFYAASTPVASGYIFTAAEGTNAIGVTNGNAYTMRISINATAISK